MLKHGSGEASMRSMGSLEHINYQKMILGMGSMGSTEPTNFQRWVPEPINFLGLQ